LVQIQQLLQRNEHSKVVPQPPLSGVVYLGEVPLQLQGTGQGVSGRRGPRRRPRVVDAAHLDDAPALVLVVGQVDGVVALLRRRPPEVALQAPEGHVHAAEGRRQRCVEVAGVQLGANLLVDTHLDFGEVLQASWMILGTGGSPLDLGTRQEVFESSPTLWKVVPLGSRISLGRVLSLFSRVCSLNLRCYCSCCLT